MQQERDPLNLGSLPMASPPADGWPQIRAELEKTQKRKRQLRYSGSALALAAMLVIAVGVFIHQPAPVQAPATVPQTLDALVSLSRQLENRVRSFRAEVGGMPTDALVYQVELEDLVAQVDDQLSMNPDSLDLWSHRVNLLLDLSQLYEKQLRRDYRRMASL